jgi:uncharacterized membrane protein YraQ (UPF0718 family)
MKILKKYLFFIIALFILGIVFIFNVNMGIKAVSTLTFSLKEMAMVLPPIFILLGLLDVWVSKEKMIKYVGEGSGIKGIIIVFVLGSVAAGPLYAAFPVAAVLMKKGAKFSNVLIFIGAWSTTKIPMFLFEMSSMGIKFAVTRLLVDIPGIIIIAYAIYFMISKKEREKIYSLDKKNPGTI